MSKHENEKGSTIRQDIATRNNQANDCPFNVTANSDSLPAKSITIALRQSFIMAVGAEPAIMLSQAIYWQKKMGNRLWYKTQKDWESEIGLSRRKQERARSILRSHKPCFWHEAYLGTPRRLYFKVDLYVLNMILPNKQTCEDMTCLPEKNVHASTCNSASHISKAKQKNKAGDFLNATFGIDSFLDRHLKSEVVENA